MPVQLVSRAKQNRRLECLFRQQGDVKPMKNSKKWFTAAAVVALSSTLAFAAPHEGGKRGRGGRGGQEFGERFAQKLNLSDAQKQQIKDAQTAFRSENKAFFDQVRDTHRQIREAKEAGNTALAEQLKA